MRPLDFLRLYEPDERVWSGDYYPSSPVEVNEGDRVAVVLLAPGEPASADQAESFLYSKYMDPVRVELPVGGRVRHWLCRTAAWMRGSEVEETYDLIGGGPEPRLARQQAQNLQRLLRTRYGRPTEVSFHTYVALRYGTPAAEETVAQMEEEGVDTVVLLPLVPQYGMSISGSMLAYWHVLDAHGVTPTWPTTAVREYAAHPKYVLAVSERIDEGLQRFGRDERDDVHLLFSARGVPAARRRSGQDSYCCLVHTTVERIVEHREDDRSYTVSFQDTTGPGAARSPSTAEALESIAQGGAQSVLVVPISHVTDHHDTRYTLDIERRKEAEAHGIDRYEVTSVLNTHPLFIEALSEAAIAQLSLPVDANRLRVRGDGASPEYPLRPPSESARWDVANSHRCGSGKPKPIAARRWREGTTRASDLDRGRNQLKASPPSSGSPAS